MKKQAQIDYTKVDYDKLNALNMQDKSLGDAYLSFKWDPLGPDFKLDLPYIEKYLKNARDKTEIKTPEFLEKGDKEAKTNFKNALQNNISLRTALQEKYDLGEFASYKGANIEEQVKDILFFLNCREQMLQIAIGKMKGSGINMLSAYKNIYSLNKKLSALLEETYRKEFNQKVILQNMLMQAQMQQQQDHLRSQQQANTLSNDLSASPIIEPIGQNLLTTARQIIQMFTSIKRSTIQFIENTFDRN